MMNTPVDCMYCNYGVIRPHEIAQGHSKCSDCRIRAFKAKEQIELVNNLGRANSRVRR